MQFQGLPMATMNIKTGPNEANDWGQVSGPAKPSLSTLPPELLLLISQNLIYPDALSLKHTSRAFYSLVYTDIELKIEWLIERRSLHLDCPHDKRCELGSDMRFCRGSVNLLMKRRREHGECDTVVGGRGCLVFGSPICTLRKRPSKLKSLMEWAKKDARLVWWLFVGLVGVIIGLLFRGR